MSNILTLEQQYDITQKFAQKKGENMYYIDEDGIMHCGLLPKFEELLKYDDICRYKILVGNGGSGKSAFFALYTLMRLYCYKGAVELLFMKHKEKAIRTIYMQMIREATRYGIQDAFVFRSSPCEIICKHTGSRAIPVGKDDVDKLGEAEISGMHCDEAIFVSEMHFDKAESRIRSLRIPPSVRVSFNPPPLEHWITKRWFPDIDHADELGNLYDIHNNIIYEIGEPVVKERQVLDIFTNQTVSTKAVVLRTSFQDNPFLPAEIAAVYAGYKYTNPMLYKQIYLGIFGSSELGSIFKQEHYREWDRIPQGAEGVVYVDPNFAKKAQGDTTAITKLLFSYNTRSLYVESVYVDNTTSHAELLDIILRFAKDPRVKAVGCDGHHGQSGRYKDIFDYIAMQKKVYVDIDFKYYNVDESAKDAQFLYDTGRILFPPKFRDSVYGARYLHQLFSFNGKRFTDHLTNADGQKFKDDAPDSLVCAVQFIMEKNLAWIY